MSVNMSVNIRYLWIRFTTKIRSDAPFVLIDDLSLGYGRSRPPCHETEPSLFFSGSFSLSFLSFLSFLFLRVIGDHVSVISGDGLCLFVRFV